MKKARMVWLPDGEKKLRQTDRRTPQDGIGRACIASRGKKTPTVRADVFMPELYSLGGNTMLTFCREMLCSRGICRHAVSVRLSVRPSVTFVNSVETNKRIWIFLITFKSDAASAH